MALPSEYIEATYIKATGTQYINTGVIATSKTTAKYKVLLDEIGKVGPHILSGKNFFFPLFRNYTASGYGFAYRGGNEINFPPVHSTGVDYEIDAFANNKIVVNGTEQATLTCGATTSDTTALHLMTYGGQPTNAQYLFKGRVYYCQIFEDGVLIRDFVPAVRKTDYVVGMYDRANDVFYTNAGTGVFEGVSVDDPLRLYKRLEYIESNGTQWINTGLLPTANFRIVSDVEIISSELTKIYGSRDHIYPNLCRAAFDFLRIGDGTWQIMYGDKTAISEQTFDTGRCKIDHNRNIATVTTATGVYEVSVDGNFGTRIYNAPIYIFTNNNMGDASSATPLKLFSMKMYDGETLVRDFVPAQSMVGATAGAVGLLDVANGVFYTNKGTGTFIAGPELPDDPVEDEAVLFGMAVINGVALPISAGMVMLDGVALPITGGMTKINGVITPITM